MRSSVRKFFYIAVVGALASCGGTEDEPQAYVPTPPKPEPVHGYQLESTSRVFGFTTQNRYSYCPSALRMADGSTEMFFCGNPVPDVMVDNIYHITIGPDGHNSPAVSVLQPGAPGTWDNQHTCDPSVVKGRFRFNGEEYAYAMFYLGCTVEYYYNEVGVAFANSLDAKEWAKYPEPIVGKSWTTVGDQEYAPGAYSWGTGQPSAVSLDKGGKVLLSYTLGDMSGTRILLRELDLSDMSSPVVGDAVTMSNDGLLNADETGLDYTCNSDIALDSETGTIVMIRPVQPHPTSYPAYLNEFLEIDRIGLEAFRSGSGTWEPLYRLTPSDTGFPRNHNACVVRDEYGYVYGTDEIEFYYTVSKAAPDVAPGQGTHAEWTYHIYRGGVRR